jgi:hypothetical protein
LSNSAATFVANVASELSGPIAGQFVQAALGGLLGASDQTAKKLDLLINEPFNTGIVAAKRAVFLKPTTVADRKQRINDLESAIHDLDRAYSMSPDDPGRQAYIRLIQGLVARMLGGRQYSAHFLGEASELFAGSLVQVLDKLQDDAGKMQEAAINLPSYILLVSEVQTKKLQELISKYVKDNTQFGGNWQEQDRKDFVAAAVKVILSIQEALLCIMIGSDLDPDNAKAVRFWGIVNLYLCAGGDPESVIRSGIKSKSPEMTISSEIPSHEGLSASLKYSPWFFFAWSVYHYVRTSRFASEG